MKALSFTTARRQQQPEPQPQPAAAAARRGAEAAPRAPGGPAGGAAGGQRDADSAEALAAGGREALSAVAGFIALPWTRELAKRKLRRELRGGPHARARAGAGAGLTRLCVGSSAECRAPARRLRGYWL